MFGEEPILIVEDDPYWALDLSMAVEDWEGRVVGPVATVAEAMAVLESDPVAAAVLDIELADGDVTPVIKVLGERGIPFVVQTGTGLPSGIAELHPNVPVVMKPSKPANILARLLNETSIAGP